MFEDKIEELKKVCYTDVVKKINKHLKENDFKKLNEIEDGIFCSMRRKLSFKREYPTNFPQLYFLRKSLIYLYSSEEYLNSQ